MLSTNNLRNSTVVITGASSGIGHGTALAFAREGANLVLAARNESTLNDVADECKKYGVNTIIVPTDVTDADAVARLALIASKAFNGRIDVWVNDAGVGAVGAFDRVPAEAHKQVVSVNLIGYMNGVHAVLPYLKMQESGTIINMNSLGAFIPSPYAASYTASKFGLRGFMTAIRAELRKYPDIHVCDVYPSFVGSPGMKHGANYTGVAMKPVHPYVSAHKVARVIVDLAKNPKNTQMVGLTAKVARVVGPHAPGLFASIMGMLMEYHMRHGKSTPVTNGNLFSPTPKSTAQIEGHYGSKTKVVASVAMAAGIGLLAWKLANPSQKVPADLR